MIESRDNPMHEVRGEMTINVLDKLAALIKQERHALLRGGGNRCGNSLQLGSLTSRRSTITFPDYLTNWLRHSNQSLTRRSPKRSWKAAPQLMVCSGFKTHLILKKSLRSTTSFAAVSTSLADDNGLNLQGKAFHIINRVFDHAIGLALQTYATQRARSRCSGRREEYLAFVAHDLRTPLNAISLAGRVLELTLPERGTALEAARMLKALCRSVRQLEGLVGQVLEENTNLQTEIGIKLERREFDLWPLVEALIHDLHPVAGTASTQLINKVPDDLVVHADASLLRRIFQNLIANAIKYTPRGDVIIGSENLGAESRH